MGRLLLLIGTLIWEACSQGAAEDPQKRYISTGDLASMPEDSALPQPQYDFAQSIDISQPDLTRLYCDQYSAPCADGIDSFFVDCRKISDKPTSEYQLDVHTMVKGDPARYQNGLSFYFAPNKCPANPNDIVKPSNLVLKYDQPLPQSRVGDVWLYTKDGNGNYMPNPKYTGLNCFVIGWKTDCMDSICIDPLQTLYREVVCP